MSVKLVYVYFPTEKSNYVVDVQDVVDFKPKSVEDFDKKKKYDVMWPVLRRQNSDTTESVFKAYIRCLAGEM